MFEIIIVLSSNDFGKYGSICLRNCRAFRPEYFIERKAPERDNISCNGIINGLDANLFVGFKTKSPRRSLFFPTELHVNGRNMFYLLVFISLSFIS